MYEHRFGFKNKRNDCRHDPARFGIFIHGGSSVFPFVKPTDTLPWEVAQGQRYSANRFSLTIPTRDRTGKDIPDSARSTEGLPKCPTFNRAVTMARKLREDRPELAACPIYACTDMLMCDRCSGKAGVQLILP